MNEESSTQTIGLQDLVGYQVLDKNDKKIGKVDDIWEDANGEAAFLSISTGWLGMGKNYFIPADAITASSSKKAIRLPYDEEVLKGAPQFESTADIDEDTEKRLFEYYHAQGLETRRGRSDWTASEGAAETHQEPFKEGTAAREGASEKEKGMELKEEVLNVGKRTVEAGGVRLRKIIRKETVREPVELEHEEIEIERVPASREAPEAGFTEEEIFIPLRKEEAVVGKSARVTEEVKARKRTETERENIAEELRKEDVQIEKDRE